MQPRTTLLRMTALLTMLAAGTAAAQDFSFRTPLTGPGHAYDREAFTVQVEASNACFWLPQVIVRPSGNDIDVIVPVPSQCSDPAPAVFQAQEAQIDGLEAGDYSVRLLTCTVVDGESYSGCTVADVETLTVQPVLGQELFEVLPERPVGGETFQVRGPDFCHAPYPMQMTREGNRVRLAVDSSDACEPNDPVGASNWTVGPLPPGQYVFRFVICDMECVPVQEFAVTVTGYAGARQVPSVSTTAMLVLGLLLLGVAGLTMRVRAL